MDITVKGEKIKFVDICIEKEITTITKEPLQYIIQDNIDTQYKQLQRNLCSNHYYKGYKYAMKQMYLLLGGKKEIIEYFINELERN